MEDKNYLLEAFRAFDDLKEDVFDISVNDGLEKAREFQDEIVDDTVTEIVIDPLAAEEEEVKDSYVGKAILKCSICQSMIYKNPEEVVIDKEAELSNVGEPCPYCQSEDGYLIIGEVAEFCPECHDEEKTEEEKPEESSEEVEVKSEEEIEKKDEEDIEKKDIDESIKSKKSIRLKESDKPAATSIEDAQKWVDFDMKRYGKISERTNRLVKKAGFQIIKDDHGDYEVTAGKFESMKEDFQKVDIETDKEKMTMTSEENGRVVVTTEPKEEVKEEIKDSEVIEPVSDEVKAQFKTVEKEPEEVDYDFDEFEESDFDELGESYLKNVYENVKAFKTTKGSIQGNKLKLEGVITFKSGKQAKTNFVFESYKATKTGKLKFIGENKQFAKGKKSFTLSGRADGKKLVCESLTYNYIGKSPDGKSKRLYGTVRK